MFQSFVLGPRDPLHWVDNRLIFLCCADGIVQKLKGQGKFAGNNYLCCHWDHVYWTPLLRPWSCLLSPCWQLESRVSLPWVRKAWSNAEGCCKSRQAAPMQSLANMFHVLAWFQRLYRPSSNEEESLTWNEPSNAFWRHCLSYDCHFLSSEMVSRTIG